MGNNVGMDAFEVKIRIELDPPGYNRRKCDR